MEGAEGEEHNVTYYISSEVNFLNSKMNSVAIIKRGSILEADKNFSSQVRVMSLSDGSPYETLHSYIANAVAPYFKSYVRVTGKADR